MIQFSNVSKVYENPVLENISFQIDPGEIYGFIGESGAGKSTILKLINQLETQTSGTIKVNNIDVSTLNNQELRLFRQDIAVIFQDYNLLMNKTVYENIELPLKLRKNVDSSDIDKVLDYVGLLPKKDSYPHSLSGGEKQRVAIARALVTNPKILLCDEPTSALDDKNTRYLLDVLRDINAKMNTTILLVTHQLEVAKAICDRVAILQNHKLQDIINVKKLQNTRLSSYSAMVKEVLER
jgi:D-methionine transport system ATP-binding protein